LGFQVKELDLKAMKELAVEELDLEVVEELAVEAASSTSSGKAAAPGTAGGQRHEGQRRTPREC
jgi:hypothetical protein